MSNLEKAIIIVVFTLIFTSYIVSIFIISKRVEELESNSNLTKAKWFDLDFKIYALSKRIAELESKDEAKPKTVKFPITDDGLKDYIPPSKPQQEYHNIIIDEAKIEDEEKSEVRDNFKIENLYAKVMLRMSYKTWITIRECIELLEDDVENVKQVKKNLEELIKDER